MCAASSHSNAVIVTGKFQKKLSTYGIEEEVRMPVYYSQVIARVVVVFGINSTRKAINSAQFRLALFQLHYSC